MKEEVNLLEGLPPAKKIRKKARRKFVPTRGIPAEVSVRRQVAEEIGDAEPTRDQKYILLQKYGAVVTVVDRRVSKPNWMGVAEWKRKLNEWFKMTKGLVPSRQEKRFRPGSRNLPAGSLTKPYPQKFNPNLKARRQDTRTFRRNSGPTNPASPRS